MEKVKMTEKQEKLVNLMKNKEFVDKVISQQSVSDVQKLFKSEGVELSETDIEALGDIIDVSLQKGEILNDEILDKVSAGISNKGAMAIGGVVGTLVGAVGGGAVGGGTMAGVAFGLKHLSKKMDIDTDKPDSLANMDNKKLAVGSGLVGAIPGVGFGAVGGGVAGVAIAKSLCKWKKR